MIVTAVRPAVVIGPVVVRVVIKEIICKSADPRYTRDTGGSRSEAVRGTRTRRGGSFSAGQGEIFAVVESCQVFAYGNTVQGGGLFDLSLAHFGAHGI